VHRQDRIFQRPEERRLHPHQEQYDEQRHDLSGEQRGHTQRHDQDFGQLDVPDQHGLVILVGQLTGRCRKQEEGQDEYPAGCRCQHRLVVAASLGQLVDHQDGHGVFEHVVVERAQGLGHEQRKKALRLQQVELRTVHRVRSPVRSGSEFACGEKAGNVRFNRWRSCNNSVKTR
jgi:hypothetical protein